MVGTQAVTFAVMTVIIMALSLAFVPEARPTVILAIPFGILFAGFVVGVSLLAASLNVLFRDVEHILTAALLPWFFLTPVVYDLGTLKTAQEHHKLLEVLRWGNPVTPPIYAFRDALWNGHVRIADVIYLVVACVVALVLGALVFRSVDDQIAVAL
jgi:ABC-type polysaccharide/polyol phosphate export permease